MILSIGTVTAASLGLALDAAALRQQAIAANIANADTPGYVPQDVRFEDQLAQARGALEAGFALRPSLLAGVRPVLHSPRNPDGSATPVQLDAQAAAMAQNSMHFQALVKGLSHHYALLSAAVSDGRR